MTQLFNLNWKDVVKGLVMAVLSGVITFVYQASTNDLSVDWNQVLQIAITSGLGYLVKNYFTTEEGKFLGKV